MRVPVGVAVIAAGVAAVVCLGACSSSGGAQQSRSSSASADATQTASARIGDLTISGGYVPAPASPDVAAAYFTVTNTGSGSDRLVKVTTDVTRKVMAMTETDHGTTGSMTDLPNVVIPAGGSFRFVPGHAHLMLVNPSRTLKAGDHVRFTVTFARAGTVHLVLPVVPITGPAPMPSMTMTGSG